MAQEPWTAERLVALASGCWPTLTLHAGVTTGLLAALARDPLPATPAELAARLGLSPRGCDLLLQALAALGLLRAENGRYALVPAARAWFDPASPASLDQAVRHHADLVPRWARLADCVRSGAPLPRPAEGEDPTGREHFFLAMRDLARQLAPGLAARLAVKPASRLLDLAGSHGIYGLTLAAETPEASAAVFDLPEAEPHFRAEAARHPGAPRTRYLAGDYRRDPLGGPYDLIWLSQVLHGEGPAACRELMAKAVAALAPGGRLVVQEFLLAAPGQGSPFAALFALNMLVNTPAGRSYAPEEVMEFMSLAGLGRIRHLGPTRPGSSAGLVEGVKA